MNNTVFTLTVYKSISLRGLNTRTIKTPNFGKVLVERVYH